MAGLVYRSRCAGSTGKASSALGQRWAGLKADKTVLDGPFAEVKESIGGLILIKAASYEEALEIAQGSPILSLGGTVEIRKGM